MTFRQSTGELTEAGGQLLAHAYAGRGGGRNSPIWQSVQNIGPLPRGIYAMGPLSVHVTLGPAIELTPDPSNRMMGRSGFFIHCPNPLWPLDSSDGCIVVPSEPTLEAIISTGEKTLTVVE